jgi:hypothetical protein
MFEITIKGETMSELASNIAQLKTQFQTTAPEVDPPARKPRAAKPKAEEPVEEETTIANDDDDADLLAPAEPMPDTAKQVVDAGTGKPADPVANAKTDAPVQMTLNDVKAAAAKLAAKDTPKLAAILKKYDAPNLSGVAKESLGDFAADIMEALG